MALHISMKGRLISLAALALLGICVLAALAIGSNQVNQRALKQLYEENIETLVRLQRVENGLLEVRFRAAGVLLEQLPVQGSLNHLRDARKALATLWSELEPRGATTFHEGDALAAFNNLREHWKLVDVTLGKLEQGYAAKDKAVLTAVLEEDWALLHKNAVKPVQALIPLTQTLSESAYTSAHSKSGTMLTTGLAVGALCFIGLIAVAWLTGRSLLRPLAEVEQSMRDIADGDLAAPLPNARKDELGRMIGALADMQIRLKGLVVGVRQCTDSIQTASAEIASGTLDLSTRTEQTASNLQQTAASMEQLTGTVKQSADSARQANQLASSAAEVAARGGSVVAQVVSTMDEINASSKKIADIISVIDGIAFQTNILALNAAVEAARAGEQGRGFAVVAAEVRNLAGRSAEAAKEIKNLITASVTRVEQGTALVDKAGNTMQEIVISIRRVTDIMGEISAASVEQSTGVAQVGEAISQMDQATQQNAALVEESAAAAESLKGQAQQLVAAVAVFKLTERAEPSASAPVAQRPPVERRGPDRAKNVTRPAFGAKAKAPTLPEVSGTKTGTDDGWASF